MKKKIRLQEYIIFGFVIPLLLIVCSVAYLLSHMNASSGQELPHSYGSFVTRSNSQLLLDNHAFRFAGANLHWLALEDSGNYPSQFEVEDGLATAKAMGLTVVRSHSLGISVGCSNCIEPKLGEFNQTAFSHVDYAINLARVYGLHLIIPLTDNYHYTSGGKHTFTDWRGISDENKFYTNTQVINDFKTYIYTLLNHVNVYTHIKYKDDPTIMAWETGNELFPVTSWTQQISAYLKGIDQKHLVMDGQKGVNPLANLLPNVDIVSNHYYPMSVNQLMSDMLAAKIAKKVFIVGEFQWNDAYGGDSLESFLSSIAANTSISGDLFWELWPHSSQYGFISNEAKFTLHYPGDSSFMQSRVSTIRSYAYKMMNQQATSEQVLTSPLLSTVTRTDTYNVLEWRGALGADRYSIERSTEGANGPWTTICDRCVTDVNVPWKDQSPPPEAAWYRVIPYSTTGIAGSASNVYQAIIKN